MPLQLLYRRVFKAHQGGNAGSSLETDSSALTERSKIINSLVGLSCEGGGVPQDVPDHNALLEILLCITKITEATSVPEPTA